MIKRIGLFTNILKDPDLAVTMKIIDLMAKYSIEPVLTDTIAGRLNKIGYPQDEFASRSDCIIVAGGDGAVLRIVSDAMIYDKPMLSINLGRLGFLTEVESCDIDFALKNLVEERFYIEERMTLHAKTGQTDRYALNEIVIQRDTNGMIKIRLKIDGNAV
ncbi:MAG TPA: NAD(+)/NADH kinase, partial [Clostridia bacterium]|nr:NAD(+)/NADH kinase [Clostridia bacterium]